MCLINYFFYRNFREILHTNEAEIFQEGRWFLIHHISALSQKEACSSKRLQLLYFSHKAVFQM